MRTKHISEFRSGKTAARATRGEPGAVKPLNSAAAKPYLIHSAKLSFSTAIAERTIVQGVLRGRSPLASLRRLAPCRAAKLRLRNSGSIYINVLFRDEWPRTILREDLAMAKNSAKASITARLAAPSRAGARTATRNSASEIFSMPLWRAFGLTATENFRAMAESSANWKSINAEVNKPDQPACLCTISSTCW